MRRPSVLTLAVACLCSLALAGSAGQAVKHFKSRFSPGMSLSTREQAVEELAKVREVEVLKAFEWALELTKKEIRRDVIAKDEATEEANKLTAQLDAIAKREIEKARKEGRDPGTVTVSRALMDAAKAARQRSERLQKQIDAEYKARQAAAAGLGAWIDNLHEEDRPDALKKIERGGLKDRDWTTRAYFARGLGHAKAREVTRLLLARLSEEDDRRVLPALVDAVAMQGGDLAVPDLLAHLEVERWQVRAAVIAGLAAIGSPAAIQPLIDRLRVEDGRLRGDISAALKALTAEDLGLNPDRWQTWWDGAKANFVPPRDRQPEPAPEEGKDGKEQKPKLKPEPRGPDADPEPAPKGEPGDEPEPEPEPQPPPRADPTERPSFYGIEVVSKRVVFVIDISGSMNEPAGDEAQKNRTKIDVAKYELETALLGLPDDATFNLIYYNEGVAQWKKGMVEAVGKNRRSAVEFVQAIQADGATNIYDALKLAFNLAGLGARDKNYEVGADTIFFLSDGEPNRGAVIDTGQILAEVQRWNELRRVKIHTVGVGKDHDKKFMKSLADASGGTYVAR